MRMFIVALLVALVPFVAIAGLVKAEIPAEFSLVEGGPDDWYAQVSMRDGLLYDVGSKTFTPYATLFLVSYRAATFEGGFQFDTDPFIPKKVVGAVTFDLGTLQDAGLDVSWAGYFRLNVGPYASYDWNAEAFSWGIMGSVLDFSHDASNTDDHRNR